MNDGKDQKTINAAIVAEVQATKSEGPTQSRHRRQVYSIEFSTIQTGVIIVTSDIKRISTPDSILDYWDAGGSSSYLYTEDRTVAKELRRTFRNYASYHGNQGTFAWQFKIPNRLLPALLKQVFATLGYKTQKNQSLKINNLADIQTQNLPQEARSTSRPTHNTPATRSVAPAEPRCTTDSSIEEAGV